MLPDPAAADTREIAELVHRYSDAVVRRDAESWIATWHPDARWRLSVDREVMGRDAILETWKRAMEGFDSVVQLVANGVASIDSEDDLRTASGTWYVHEYFRRTNGSTGIMLGSYADTYSELDGQWCFVQRELRTHYKGPADLTGDFT